MAENDAVSVRFGSSWSTQFRLTQALGKGLASLMSIKASIIVRGPGERSNPGADDIDVCFLKSINNLHRYTGSGYHAGPQPESWLRTIGWLPQEDRFLFAVAPWTGISSFEDIFENRPKLNIQGHSAPIVLEKYGFSYKDIVTWGGTVGTMEHTASEARTHYQNGQLDAFFGDGSAHDFSAWEWVAARGYRFLDINESVMHSLESEGLRRNTIPSGFLPGIDHSLNALDDSHIVLSCHETLRDEVAYNLAKALDQNKRELELASVQLGYRQNDRLPLTELSYWSSLTGPIGHQWDETILGAPLHRGARKYYEEIGVV